MQYFFTQIPTVIRNCFSQLIWTQDSGKPLLTFDDGPHPDTTPWILDELDSRDLKAMFFVVGANIEKFPSLFDQIIARGHRVGNHGYQHVAGWKLSAMEYKINVQRGADISGSNIFRPPYGQIGYRQLRAIRKKYKVMMWSVMPGDFLKKLDIDDRMNKVNLNLKTDDIIVLHDNPKHYDLMKEMLIKLKI